MNPGVIQFLVLRYLFLYTRNWVRLVELVFWPTMELVVWGFLTMYLDESMESKGPLPVTYLLGAVILWDVLFRAQQGVAISFLEDVWTRNLLNIFVAPVRTSEYLAGTFIVGFFRIVVTIVLLTVIALFAYQFNVFDMKIGLIPFFANLMVFGWSLGMISTALILRWGQAAESLAWAVPFMIQPVAAVFYPVASLPGWLQPIALALPCTHVFEGMREVLATGHVNWTSMLWATLLNVLFMALTAAFFLWILNYTRRRGLLTKVTSH